MKIVVVEIDKSEATVGQIVRSTYPQRVSGAVVGGVELHDNIAPCNVVKGIVCNTVAEIVAEIDIIAGEKPKAPPNLGDSGIVVNVEVGAATIEKECMSSHIIDADVVPDSVKHPVVVKVVYFA